VAFFNRRLPFRPKHTTRLLTPRSQHPQNAGFDATQEIRHGSESDGSETSTRADGGEEPSKADNPLTRPEQPKRKYGELEADLREPKSMRKGPSKAPRKSQPASKVGSRVRDKTYGSPKSSESFSDLTGTSQKVLEPDDVHTILVQNIKRRSSPPNARFKNLEIIADFVRVRSFLT
jgi:hypothetical protein